MTPQAFIAKWKASTLKESAASQEHFIDLCRLLEHASPAEADPDGTWFTFEKGASKTSGGNGWADVWKRGCFAWEYKGKHKDLDRALVQLQQYAVALENPPLLVVSDMELIRIHTHFTNTVQEIHLISLDELTDPAKLQLLRQVFNSPDQLKPDKTRDAVTAEVAENFASLAQRLRQRGHQPQAVAHFISKLLFCLFAEDAGLFKGGRHILTEILEACREWPDHCGGSLKALFAAMSHGGIFGTVPIDHFNGGLFDGDDILPLEREDLRDLLHAAYQDWRDIEPSIFGTLFERGLDPDKRSQLGAHYTDPASILRIVRPVVLQPLETKWAQVKATIQAALKKSKAKGIPKPALDAYNRFMQQLAAVRILDPACGSGNFLYLALRGLKDLEHRANLEAEALGLPRQFSINTGPCNVFGIELNPYAAELARVTLWIGHIQWMLRNGYNIKRNPVLDNLDQIQCADALINHHGQAPVWPQVDFIVGNPPFLGGSKMLDGLGESYVTRLRHLYQGRVPGGADLVTYWFERARDQLQRGQAKAAGLVSTNSIRGGANRKVLERIRDTGRIFNAWSDEPWVNEGAAVRVSIVCFEPSPLTPLPGGEGNTAGAAKDAAEAADIANAANKSPSPPGRGVRGEGKLKGSLSPEILTHAREFNEGAAVRVSVVCFEPSPLTPLPEGEGNTADTGNTADMGNTAGAAKEAAEAANKSPSPPGRGVRGEGKLKDSLPPEILTHAREFNEGAAVRASVVCFEPSPLTPLPEGEGNTAGAAKEAADAANKSPSPPGRGARGEGKLKGSLPPEILTHARELRQNQTNVEKLLWGILRGRRFLNLKFRRQHPITPYILDFYCEELKFGIELDGGQHNEEAARRYDETRSAFLAAQGIQIIRFWNLELLTELEAVLEALYWTVVKLKPALTLNPSPEGRGTFTESELNYSPEGRGTFTESEPNSSPEGRGTFTESEILSPPTEHNKPLSPRERGRGEGSDENWLSGLFGAVTTPGVQSGAVLDGETVEEIYADLTGAAVDGVNLAGVKPLLENEHISFQGSQKIGDFDIPGDLAREWLPLPNPNGRSNCDVLKPSWNGLDLARRPRDMWIIDFGTRMTEEDAALYEKPFGYVFEHVKPEREQNNREAYRKHWWRHGEPRIAMRAAIEKIGQYIATPEVSKYRIFVWMPSDILPDKKLMVIARNDDTTFGVLHSRFHELWSLKVGSWHGKGNDPRYTPSTTFQTFPFPAGLTPNIPAEDYAADPRAVAIAAAAQRLNQLRENWLNPPEWIKRVPEVVPGYPDRLLPVDDHAAQQLKQRTLTNLYNQRPAWLDHAHQKLDAAVAAAYGWPSDLSDDEILRRLLALNQARAMRAS